LYSYTRPEDISPEKVDQIIDRAANFLVNRLPGVSDAAMFFIELYKPVTYIAGEFGRMSTIPFFAFLSNDSAENVQQYITVFEQRENLDRLIQRIDVLSRKTKEERKIKKTEDKDNKKPFSEKIKSLFRRKA
jgi:uncharacterized membrane protein YheB (UPF0754 family)